ncbi:aldehyde dehydrogenase family protein, partial [uncultured Ralstonia sp.]
MSDLLDPTRATINALDRITDRSLVKTQSYVDGAWVGAADGATFPVHDPATNAHLADVANLGHAETLRAIDAANAAWAPWRTLTGKERAGLLRRWFDLLIAHADDLGALMTAEQGKPLAEAKGEIIYGASFIEWFAEEAKRVSGDVMASTWRD